MATPPTLLTLPVELRDHILEILATKEPIPNPISKWWHLNKLQAPGTLHLAVTGVNRKMRHGFRAAVIRCARHSGVTLPVVVTNFDFGEAIPLIRDCWADGGAVDILLQFTSEITEACQRKLPEWDDFRTETQATISVTYDFGRVVNHETIRSILRGAEISEMRNLDVDHHLLLVTENFLDMMAEDDGEDESDGDSDDESDEEALSMWRAEGMLKANICTRTPGKSATKKVMKKSLSQSGHG